MTARSVAPRPDPDADVPPADVVSAVARLRVRATSTLRVGELSATRAGAPFHADPVAWLVSDATGAVLRRAAAGPEPPVEGGHTGVIAVSCEATRHTARALAGASRDGRRVSPMRFAAANAGSIAGVACIVHGLTGPSLVLSMPPVDARAVAETVARSWLESAACRAVVLAEHTSGAAGHVVLGALLALP